MNRRRITAAALLAVLAFAALPAAARPGKAPPSAGPKTPFSVGAAAVSADPDEPVCLGGYGSFCTRRSETSRDELFARALSVTGGGQTLIVVTTTNIGLFAAYKDAMGPNGVYDIRQRVAERTGVPAANVVVVSDHSHAGPDTIGLWGGVSREYLTQVADATVDAAAEAFTSRQPARLSVARVMGPRLKSSYAQGPTDTLDEEFRALFADDLEGRRIATFVNYSPHATVLGSRNTSATGDWTAWSAQVSESLAGGVGLATVGSLGASDWNKIGGSEADREAEARDRLQRMTLAAESARVPVTGRSVGVETVFVRETLTQPILGANFLPPVPVGDSEVRIDRAVTPPWYTGNTIGTYVTAARIGDVFLATAPGEPFPQIQFALRERGGVQGVQAHFLLGGAQDFLGYMVDSTEAYAQTAREGTTFLAGCPEEEALDHAEIAHDPACPDHWTLMVSPTMGTHVICSAQDAADRLGLATGERDRLCAGLTALDNQAAPSEHPGSPPGKGPKGTQR